MSQDADAFGAPERTLLHWRPPSSTLAAWRDTVEGQPVGDPAERASMQEQEGVEEGVDPPASGGPVFDDKGALLPGALIGDRYVIEGHISSGSFGAVYKASDRLIDQHAVAIKYLHKAVGSNRAADAALRELRLIASVSHPSVVQFKDYGWLDGRLWFAMPWYEGCTLQERLTGRDGAQLCLGRLQARPIFERLAYGLAAMHSVGVRHHDIKPENVFLSEVAGFDAGLPVLLDLGIASERDEQPQGFTTEYSAPETAARALGREGMKIGDAADVFALALTLRAALEPDTMPERESPSMTLLHRRASVPVRPPSGTDLKYLAPHFRRWLSLEPDARPTAVQFARELAVLTEPEERREARRRMLRRLVPVVLLAALAVGVLAWQLREQTAELSVQRERLTEQMQETQRLRQWSAQALMELDTRAEAVGEKDKQLGAAQQVARKLDDRLSKAERERRALQRALRKQRTDYRALTGRHEALQAERDELEQQWQALGAERDRVAQDLQAESLAREELEHRARDLRQQRDYLTRQHNRLKLELAELAQRVADGDRSVAALGAERDALLRERERLTQGIRQLEGRLSSRTEPQGFAGARLQGGTGNVGSPAASGKPVSPMQVRPAPEVSDSPSGRSGLRGNSKVAPPPPLPPAPDHESRP